MHIKLVVCKSEAIANVLKFFISPTKFIPIILTILILFPTLCAQQTELGTETRIHTSDDLRIGLAPNVTMSAGEKEEGHFEVLKSSENDQFAAGLQLRFPQKQEASLNIYRAPLLKPSTYDQVEEYKRVTPKFPTRVPEQSTPLDSDERNPHELDEKFHWKPAVIQSLYFLSIQHGLRLVQQKTKRELDGPFFRDWGRSVRNLSDWEDGDGIATNYIFHPMQGAVTGWIFLVNSDKSIKQQFGKSKDYWESRLKAMAWSAAWSAQFELGPISEASIGNVGLYDNVGPNTMGWVDLVITPVAGTGVITIEDIIDKYILRNWLEKRLQSRTRIKIYRTFFNPFQSFVNVLSLKKPWRRRNRF